MLKDKEKVLILINLPPFHPFQFQFNPFLLILSKKLDYFYILVSFIVLKILLTPLPASGRKKTPKGRDGF